MVAIQAATTAVLAITGSKVALRLPQLLPDPRTDAALKAALSLGLVLAAVWVKPGWGKSILVGTGVGLAVGSLMPLMPSLAR
jgi:hypothetical protein